MAHLEKEKTFWIDRYFTIDEDGIIIKIRAFKKEQHSWDDVASLKIEKTKLVLHLKSNADISIPKSYLFYDERKRLQNYLFRLRDKGKVDIIN